MEYPFKEHWNTHTIRVSSQDTISGKPCELFALPESRGGENRLHPVSAEDVDFVAENLLQIDEVPNYQEYFEIHTDKHQLRKRCNLDRCPRPLQRTFKHI